MFEFIYQTLTSFGCNHPIHPSFTHMPIGRVIGGLYLCADRCDYSQEKFGANCQTLFCSGIDCRCADSTFGAYGLAAFLWRRTPVSDENMIILIRTTTLAKITASLIGKETLKKRISNIE
jgi:hypothetical protein